MVLSSQNRITSLFQEKQHDVLSVYFTAGFPRLDDTTSILETLQECGVDVVEIGMPFSDPVADGPTIQESSTEALQNGMTTALLFEQLRHVRATVRLPLVLMGYVNPVLQFGIEKFCAECAAVGIDGVILPDLPRETYLSEWKPIFDKYHLHFIMLITPQTPEARVRSIDAASSGFVYAVSSSGTTGGALAMDDARIAYFQRLKHYRAEKMLANPTMIGFGIHDKASFDAACEYANGAIIGSAFIKAISGASSTEDLKARIRAYLGTIRS